MQIIKRHMLREYAKYVLPTMLAFTLSSVYGIVDGIFVGHAVGNAGLAGINVAFPLVAFIMAVGTGLGMGGGVISSIARGSGDEDKAQRALGTTFILLLLAAVPIMAVLLLFGGDLCALLGGRGSVHEQAAAYVSVIAWGVPFQIVATGCIPLIRNKGSVAYVMVVQLLAGGLNVVLDFAFVMMAGWGTAGAAGATVVSQAVAFCFVAGHFLVPRNRIAKRFLHVDGSIALHAIRLGMAPFGLTLLPEATVVAMNVNAVAYGGETAVAAYAVIAYVACVVQMLIQGVGDGSQPLISKYFGAGDGEGVRRVRNTNYLFAIGLGAVGLAALYSLRDVIPGLFGATGDAAALVAWALPIFSTAYLFYGFTHTSTSYFYAIDDARASSAVVYGEAVLVVVCVFGLGRLFGLDGIWLAVTTVQMMLSVIVAFLLRRRHESRAFVAVEKAVGEAR